MSNELQDIIITIDTREQNIIITIDTREQNQKRIKAVESWGIS